MAEWLDQARQASGGLAVAIPNSALRTLRQRVDQRVTVRSRVRAGAKVLAALAIVAGVTARFQAREASTLSAPKRASAPAAAPAPAAKAPPASVDARAAAQPEKETLRLTGARAWGADVRLTRDDETGTHVVMGIGAASFEVEPRAAHRPFVVEAGSVRVMVTGTRFSITRSAAAVEVMVVEGAVEVVAGPDITRLSAGQRHAFETDARASEAPIEVGRKAGRDAVGELLAEADHARREGRSEDAVSALRTLVRRHAGDPRAPSAAFSLGRVLLDNQGRPAEAAAAFAQVVRLDADGPLVEDALAREIEAWAKAGARDRVERLARTYLARFPQGARASFVRAQAGLE